MCGVCTLVVSRSSCDANSSTLRLVTLGRCEGLGFNVVSRRNAASDAPKRAAPSKGSPAACATARAFGAHAGAQARTQQPGEAADPAPGRSATARPGVGPARCACTRARVLGPRACYHGLKLGSPMLSQPVLRSESALVLFATVTCPLFIKLFVARGANRFAGYSEGGQSEGSSSSCVTI